MHGDLRCGRCGWMQGVEVQRMAPLRKPSNEADTADAAPSAVPTLGTGDFGPLRRCSSLQGTYLAADSAPRIGLELDPSQTP
jgi:hypothetical protein